MPLEKKSPDQRSVLTFVRTAGEIGHPLFTDVDACKSMAYANGLVRLSGLSITKLDAKYCRKSEESDPPRIVHKWATGKALPSKDYAELFEGIFPGSSASLEWALWSLFRQRNLSERSLIKYLCACPDKPSRNIYFICTKDQTKVPAPPYVQVTAGLPDLSSRTRVDAQSFENMLGYVRLAESVQDWNSHGTYSEELFAHFPGLVQHPDLRPLWRELLDLSAATVLRQPNVYSLFTIDVSILETELDRKQSHRGTPAFIVPKIAVPIRNVKEDLFGRASYISEEYLKHLFSSLG